jgi:four helix bundle protein
MPYKTFEELEVYQLAREFRKEIYKLIKRLPDDEKYNLESQMRRAATSLTNNIAEGDGRFHFQENSQFCRQSRGSLCVDESYFQEEYLNRLKSEAYRIGKLLNGYITYLRRHKVEEPTT